MAGTRSASSRRAGAAAFFEWESHFVPSKLVRELEIPIYSNSYRKYYLYLLKGFKGYLEVRVFWGLSIGVTLLFILFPEIDLAFSGMFYEKAAGGFFLNNRGFHVLHSTITNGGRIISLALGVLLAVSWLSTKVNTHLPPQRILSFLLLTFALGPGLLVNTIFKDQFGRSRPNGVSEFGGVKTFTPAFYISDQCDKNCSFVCGDCSAGFATLAFALLARRHRKRYITGALVFGSLIGLMRIMQGAHFLSDVIFSGVFTTLLTYALYRLLKPVVETCTTPRAFL